ncbi:hypothetical protein BT63DRAFT_455725 [Microthyrium microscopicum]|uniref:Mitochondrial zinc maintenance protein 1, mitochondrial n=1 Tax=Microthyrium microscopicum TaxID=703497 RepID=A0A6A6UDW1_9PEZI|nr:hypothetical protein BT63DRAFT_455725 [Microthyrium microscopicum]
MFRTRNKAYPNRDWIKSVRKKFLSLLQRLMMPIAEQTMALSAYRTLLRSTRIAFQGDPRTLIASRQKARASFEEARSLSLGSPEAAEKIAEAQEVAKILRENVLQGMAVEGKENTYKLRIHEHTELGDNDSRFGSPPEKTKNQLSGVKTSRI